MYKKNIIQKITNNMYNANKKNNFNDRPSASYASICDLQLVG